VRNLPQRQREFDRVGCILRQPEVLQHQLRREPSSVSSRSGAAARVTR
jgi:hypothetical protein